ncbi:phosphorylase [Trinickia caryophylli]|uniref:Hopanoid-associated phosphorylase n=1 Tax=Trinickia caryophylli TaxID=28094 RepID=A0A1X7G490_TRICW|nr:phosphorylase [Trinickia caryophylli]PMS13771.1 hypothetical protein C0Z17_02550 [Trinickia caryophylli]TRX14271.1 phosphorylase [Trinickia caryophylli]WQE14102.1 phosphorylase [Trinickia caryophylli]SMF63732.1 hopanoid-associated phosphorylase [Trinickia caryophylli]GLU33404.1 hypothetical protein Busp01_32460 [Trinickia caryophylli]
MIERAAVPVIAVTGMAFEARIARGAGVRTVHAARTDLLQQALAEALADGASGIISFGTAGGLADGLMPGTLIVADRIDGPFGRTQADPRWTERIADRLAASGATFPIHRGTLAAVAQAVTGVEAKRALNQAHGALAVDMESHIAAAMAGTRGLPFAACRVVVDPAWRSLPPAAMAGLRDDGSTALLPILAELARAPRQLRDLIRLAADARAARKTLVAARRVLGDGLGFFE